MREPYTRCFAGAVISQFYTIRIVAWAQGVEGSSVWRSNPRYAPRPGLGEFPRTAKYGMRSTWDVLLRCGSDADLDLDLTLTLTQSM